MPKEYRTIEEVAGPIMLVRGVQGVTYDEMGEIELVNGERRRCKYSCTRRLQVSTWIPVRCVS